MNRKAKGSRRERQTRDLLREQEYAVMKAGASLGIFDLIGIGKTDFVLAQVKSNRWPESKEMEAIRAFECPANCRKVVYRWRDYVKEPDVMVVQ
jgi:Holliday junction resolvase